MIDTPEGAIPSGGVPVARIRGKLWAFYGLPEMVGVFAGDPYFWPPTVTYTQSMGDLRTCWVAHRERVEAIKERLKEKK